MNSARILKTTLAEIDQWRNANNDLKCSLSVNDKIKATESLIDSIDDQRSLLNAKQQQEFLQAISDHVNQRNYYPQVKTYRWWLIPSHSEAVEYIRLKQAMIIRLNLSAKRRKQHNTKHSTTTIINSTMNMTSSIKLFILSGMQVVSSKYVNIFFTYGNETFSANIIGGNDTTYQENFIQEMLNNRTCGIAAGSYQSLGNQFRERACGYPKDNWLSPNNGQIAFYSLNKNVSLPVLNCLIDYLEHPFCPDREPPSIPYLIIIGSVFTGIVVIGGLYYKCMWQPQQRSRAQAPAAAGAISLEEQKELKASGPRVFNGRYEKLEEQIKHLSTELQTGALKDHAEQPVALDEVKKISAQLKKLNEDCSCSICTNILETPTTLVSQKTYDVECIRTWLQTNSTDPINRQNIFYHKNNPLPINTDKKNQIETLLKEIEDNIEKLMEKMNSPLPTGNIRVAISP